MPDKAITLSYQDFKKSVYIFFLRFIYYHFQYPADIGICCSGYRNPVNGTIRGRSLSSDQQPVAVITISLKETRIDVSADPDGNFRLKAPSAWVLAPVVTITVKTILMMQISSVSINRM